MGVIVEEIGYSLRERGLRGKSALDIALQTGAVPEGTDEAGFYAALAAYAAEENTAQQHRTDWQAAHELPTSTRSGMAQMMDPTRIIITMWPRAADYRDGYTRTYTDRVQFEMRNLKTIYHSDIAADCWVLMGVRTCFDDEWVDHINYSWDRIVGITTNNGQIFSMFDPIGFYGSYSGTTAAEMMAGNGAGPGHGNFDQLTGTILVYGGIKNGATIADGTAIQATLQPGEIINFTTLDFNGTRAMKDPTDDSTVVTSVDVRRFGGGYQMMMNSVLTFGADAGVAVGYGFNNCFRLANRLQGRNKAGNLITPTCATPGHVSGQTAIAGLADSAVISFPECVRITGWKDTKPGHAFELELPATIQPARRNGVEIAYDNAGIVSDEAAGPKYRQPIWIGSGDVTDESTNAITFFASFNGVRADGA